MPSYFIKLSRKDCHKFGIGRHSKEVRRVQDMELGEEFMRMFYRSRKRKAVRIL